MIKFKVEIETEPEPGVPDITEISGQFPDAVSVGALVSIILALEQVVIPHGNLTDDHLLRLAGMTKAELAIDASLRTIVDIAAHVKWSDPDLLALELRMAEAQLRWSVAYRSQEIRVKHAEVQADPL